MRPIELYLDNTIFFISPQEHKLQTSFMKNHKNCIDRS